MWSRFLRLRLRKYPVIRNAEGGLLTSPRYWFEPAVKKAKILTFSWHCLRHTFASRLVMAGVDLRTVQELMGHKSIQMTVRYSHLTPKHTLAAVERLNGAFRWLQLTPELAPAKKRSLLLSRPVFINSSLYSML
jgi:integrase